MHTVKVDFPAEWNEAHIYPLSDLHIGDPHCLNGLIAERFDMIQKDPHGLVILNGDLLNTALKNSVSDVYAEKLSPMAQITRLVEILEPIKDKIIGATTGNHENRVYKADGIDTMRIVCRELGFEDKYCPEGVFIFLRFGTRGTQQHPKEGRNPRQWYSIYATHGSGGGRKEGAKAIRLADMASIVDADIYIHSHTHLPMVMKEDFYRADSSNCAVHKVSKLFVNTSAALTYGGYGQSYEFKPSSIHSPIIHLEAKHKRATATL